MKKEYKCEECKSKNVVHTYHDDGGLSYLTCQDCQHITQYFRINAMGRKVLEELLDDA